MINEFFSQTILVSNHQTAEYLGSGDLPVFATPAMIAIMENTAMRAITDLAEGQTSVGISIQTSHLKASLVGATIDFKATIIGIEGRKYTFHIIATDGNGDTIGEGMHERVVVDKEKFMSKIR